MFCFGKIISPADRKILVIDMFRRPDSCDKYAIGGFKVGVIDMTHDFIHTSLYCRF